MRATLVVRKIHMRVRASHLTLAAALGLTLAFDASAHAGETGVVGGKLVTKLSLPVSTTVFHQSTMENVQITGTLLAERALRTAAAAQMQAARRDAEVRRERERAALEHERVARRPDVDVFPRRDRHPREEVEARRPGAELGAQARARGRRRSRGRRS